MPVTTGTAVLAGASLLGGAMSSSASRRAASAQTQAADQAAQAQREAIAEQRRQFEIGRQDLEPWRLAGGSALMSLLDMAGVQRPRFQAMPGATGQTAMTTGADGLPVDAATTAATSATANPNQTAFGDVPTYRFQASPGYAFRRDEGIKAVDRGAAARGLLGSGARLRSLMRFGDGLAADEFDRGFNRLAGIAGVGQSATNTGVQLGQQYAGQVGQNAARQGEIAMQSGNARASGYIGGANAWNSALGNGLYLAGRFGMLGG